jgi:hypothetical protein
MPALLLPALAMLSIPCSRHFPQTFTLTRLGYQSQETL